MRKLVAIMMSGLIAACGTEPDAPPPPDNLSFEGLPVMGDLAFAQAAGFTQCTSLRSDLRCQREGLQFGGGGPFHAAIDARGTEGRSGFYELTLWDRENQASVSRVGTRLVEQGWDECRTGEEDRGDQRILTRAGSPVRVSIDITYWGHRRLRILPERGQPTGHCW